MSNTGDRIWQNKFHPKVKLCLGHVVHVPIDTNIFWDLGELAINGALLIQNSGTIENKIIIKNIYTVMICWQKYLSLYKYSKLLHE